MLLLISQRDQLVLSKVDFKTRHTVFLSVPGLQQHLPRGPSPPKRGYSRGTSTVTRPTLTSPTQFEDRPVQARDLADFKSDMTSLIQDMIESSLSSLPPSLKPSLAVRETPLKIELKRSLEIKILLPNKWIKSILQRERKESCWPLRKRTLIYIKGILTLLNW